MKLVAESLYEYKSVLLSEDTVGLVDIPDVDRYLTAMMKGIDDKIDLISQISPDCLIDFGCADAYVTNVIEKKYSKIQKIIGYDIDERMVVAARSKYPSLFVTDKWNEVVKETKNYKNVALTLISVLHEIYAYLSENDVQKLWKDQIFNSKWKWILIRDMSPLESYKTMKPSKEDIEKLKYYSKDHQPYYNSFEEHWGKITDNVQNMLHWLLKYDYKQNWEREITENYLSLPLETIKSQIPAGWNIKYEDHYVLPFIKNKIKKEWDITLKYPTHIKLIIENTNIK